MTGLVGSHNSTKGLGMEVIAKGGNHRVKIMLANL